MDHGKTIFVLENKHGNDGYAFWFKLLEELGRHENHVFDLRDDAELEYFASRAWTTAGETLARLDLLARIGAIDPGLWADRIVWSDRFVENIADAYRKRKSTVPARPRLTDSGTLVFAQSAAGNPQTKAEETKSDETLAAPPAGDFTRFAQVVTTQFAALYCQSFGKDYRGQDTDGEALRTAWEALRDKPDRVDWVADCLSTLFARPAETRPRSLAYCVRKLVEDYDKAHREAGLSDLVTANGALVRKLERDLGDPAMVRRLLLKHGPERLRDIHKAVSESHHSQTYERFRARFFALLRKGDA